MKIFRFALTAAVAVCAVSAVVPSVFAQDKMAPKMSPKMGGKMAPMMAPVYVCKACKMGYTEAQAKTMMMKDPMGHKLVKMAKVPTGYKMAPAKMDPKMGGKMAPKPKM